MPRSHSSGAGVDKAPSSRREQSLVDWLERIESERRNAVLTVEMVTGKLGRLWCMDGEVIDAECGELVGEDAVYQVFALENGEVSVAYNVVDRPRVIHTPTRTFLLHEKRRQGVGVSTRLVHASAQADVVPSWDEPASPPHQPRVSEDVLTRETLRPPRVVDDPVTLRPPSSSPEPLAAPESPEGRAEAISASRPAYDALSTARQAQAAPNAQTSESGHAALVVESLPSRAARQTRIRRPYALAVIGCGALAAAAGWWMFAEVPRPSQDSPTSVATVSTASNESVAGVPRGLEPVAAPSSQSLLPKTEASSATPSSSAGPGSMSGAVKAPSAQWQRGALPARQQQVVVGAATGAQVSSSLPASPSGAPERVQAASTPVIRIIETTKPNVQIVEERPVRVRDIDSP